MTLYWWSHWFWITLLGTLLFITIVHTYPSQEISLEYNQNSKPLKTVTKLHQATSTLTWPTTPPSSSKVIDVTDESVMLQSMQSDIEKEDELLEFTEVEEENEAAESEEEADHIDVEEETDEAVNVDDSRNKELEFKRSAENFNNATEGQARSKGYSISENNQVVAAEAADMARDVENIVETAGTGIVKLKRQEAEVNNYTNFSSSANVLSTNDSIDSNANTASANSTEPQAATDKSSSTLPAVPAAPKINNAHSTLEWFNTLAAQLPPTDVTANSGAIDGVTLAEKAPFTLENVNKEDELRRAENEHRSRKSKVLSAEYKHINRFINFSSDSKSLLARSASTAPNEFENDEGNISSEALSIQRTYFLDAGAISAICFTVFGICCTVGTIGIVLYRRRYWNKPQALSEPDSSVYIDDSTMRDNSDEMYSLDNDSFLNSLEAMTIQNYWTDTVKHTKL